MKKKCPMAFVPNSGIRNESIVARRNREYYVHTEVVVLCCEHLRWGNHHPAFSRSRVSSRPRAQRIRNLPIIEKQIEPRLLRQERICRAAHAR